MLPTIEINDRIIANRFIYHFRPIERGDIIVFGPPGAAATSAPYVKRVIALGGDTVEIRDGLVLVNQEEVQIDGASSPAYKRPAEKVPDGMLFVLGDDRNQSSDSHIWGFLPEDRVIGRVDLVYWPLSRLGGL